MGLPPFDAGATHDTATLPSPGVATTWEAAPGTVRGIADADAADGADHPAELCAATVNEYDDPFTRPDTLADNTEPSTDTDATPGDATTRYPDTLHPSAEEAVHVTVTDPSAGTTVG